MAVSNQTQTITDINGVTIVVATASAVPTSGLMTAGSDGTNARFILTDATGKTVTADVGSTGSAVPTQASLIGASDGTNLVALRIKAASTAAVATDPSLVVALSPNSPAKIWDGTNTATVKAASTAAVATDTALVVAISPNNPISISGTADATATGTLGSLNAAVQVTTAGLASVGFQLATGTLIGTLVPEVSFDGGTTWATSYFDFASGLKSATLVFATSNTATAASILGVGGSGLTRVRVSAYTSGTASITVRASLVKDPSTLFSSNPGVAIPPAVALVGGSDGTFLRAIKTDTTGSQYQVITSPLASAAGLYANVSAYGTLRTSDEPSALFADEFDGGVVDTTNKWIQTTLGSGSVSLSNSAVTFNTSTIASNAAALTSIPTFSQNGLGFRTLGFAQKMEAVAITGAHHFSGFGTQPGIWAATTPLQDAIGFEQDTAGAFNACIWANGTKVFSQNLTRPSDGLTHRFAVLVRTDMVLWYVDGIEIPAASTNFPAPGTFALPVRSHLINGTSLLSSTPVQQVYSFGLADSARSNVAMSDGQFPWRQSTIKPALTAATTSDTALVVAVSPNTPVTTTAADTTASGTLGSLNAAGTLVMAGLSSAGFQLAAGTLIGTLVAEASLDGAASWVATYFDDPTSLLKTSSITFTASNTATARTIVGVGGASHYRVRVSAYTSGTASISLRASQVGDPSVLFASATNNLLPPSAVLSGGQSGGLIRPARVGRTGHTRVGFDTLLLHDSIEGTAVNTWLWAQSATTMTIAQTTGVLTLNNAGSVATTTNANLVSNRQLPLFNHGILKFAMRANAIQGNTNSFIELGFGSPVGSTAIINNGAFIRINGTAITTVISFNGTETSVAATPVINSTSYYMFLVYVEDDSVHFVLEDSSGTPIVDVFQSLPLTTPYLAAVSHLPVFARVRNAAAVTTGSKLNISSFDALIFDFNTSKPWSEQLAGSGRGANINPTTYAQTAQLAAGAAPTAATPLNTTALFTGLGGEFSINGTATSENLLGVLQYTVPSPYSLVVTDIVFPPPVVTTALGASICIQEWSLMVASSTNPSTATGQRSTLGLFSAASAAAIGTVFNGQTINMNMKTPIVVPAGQVLLFMVKVILGAAGGVIRGSVFVNGYHE